MDAPRKKKVSPDHILCDGSDIRGVGGTFYIARAVKKTRANNTFGSRGAITAAGSPDRSRAKLVKFLRSIHRIEVLEKGTQPRSRSSFGTFAQHAVHVLRVRVVPEPVDGRRLGADVDELERD